MYYKLKWKEEKKGSAIAVHENEHALIGNLRYKHTKEN